MEQEDLECFAGQALQHLSQRTWTHQHLVVEVAGDGDSDSGSFSASS